MDDRDFFDEIYQGWSKTTGAEDRWWMPEEHFDKSGRWNIYALSLKDPEDRKLIASGLTERDADFICSMHGAAPEIVRAALAAFDEADRADYERDSRECRIAELESENAELREGLVWYREHSS